MSPNYCATLVWAGVPQKLLWSNHHREWSDLCRPMLPTHSDEIHRHRHRHRRHLNATPPPSHRNHNNCRKTPSSAATTTLAADSIDCGTETWGDIHIAV
ncbi:hypothetical protein CVS40_9883 [Lucilia cuprina]|nr:hypothetical protein CVS40_9883 [Lucilia cuprina]